MAEVLDLRGREAVGNRASVLLDPTGGRARVLAWIGRAVAFVFLLWLIGLVFAGLGLIPSSALPLGRALLGPASGPPALTDMPRLTQPQLLKSAGSQSSAAAAARLRGLDRTPSAQAAIAASTPGHATGANSATRAGRGTAVARGHGHASPTAKGGGTGVTAGGGSAATTTTPAAASNSGLHAGSTAPGRTRSQSSPGHTKTSTSAGSGNSSSGGKGHQTTTTSTTTSTTPGKSGSAGGHAATH